MSGRPVLIFVGGFLGAGKTTLILRAARALAERGKRVAVITNDQDRSLVDTRVAEAQKVAAREVAGGCFCCRFSDLMEQAEGLREYEPDVIFAEPVGSCIDLSATILQPLKRFYEREYRLAPLTVLVDPAMLERAKRGEMDGDVEYLFGQQLAEADLICTTKRDLYPGARAAKVPVDFAVSGATGEGVDEWLAEVLSGRRMAGARLLEVDYGRYAEAEAALAWLNLEAAIRLAIAKSPALVCGPLCDRLEEELRGRGIFVAHLKIFDQCASGWLKVSLAGDGAPRPEGDLLAEAAEEHQLAINLRAIAEPEEMRELVLAALREVGGSLEIRHARAFRPAAPRPEHRFSATVASGPVTSG
jgi:Ni2+-binding GTPase involved in maturation of urease and hydrogenase